ncbi:DNA replication complex GINS protein PSF2 [Stereum hirsutum FP-91666 SS1]|uniref:DNA replication complex GINS protein PSF2 n=1 Tax=Stereum hirsutum (strain FP-91666) TaxID=721885 RepID=UPI000444A30B|nr:DNA replication complex GINS protein PSF2 [Stereum hirsutum FP-91666 SS1]EIM85710.1 DNA replication complex GINS protein PSF2 [Stereum hirsutum FP-91666 SS1]
MALPIPLRNSVAPTELELIASEQLIEIVPLIAMERTAFISGAYGPLRPPTKAKIPIWMAVNLKLKKKCHIVPPDWLSVEFLQERLTQETSRPVFSQLPFRFAEVAKILLDVAPDDVPNSDKIRSLLKDIREARQAKSREGLSKIDHSELSLPNLCSMEINEIRPFFIRAMGVLTQINHAEREDEP